MAMGYYLSCTGPVSHISPYQYTGDKAFKSTIYRDNLGVPHIFGNTDADAVFGLAYAHAEDDFKTIQDLLMGAPSTASEKQLKELNIKIVEKKK